MPEVTYTIKKGGNLEYTVAAVFQGQGYLVRRAVPLKYGSRGQDATDIDVLGIKFTQPFQPHRIICDCKEKQRSKPYERIFWTKGLSYFVNATETYVSFPKANFDIINFAKSGQVRILTEEVLRDSLIKTYGSERHPYGMANPSFYEPFYKRMSPLLGKETEAAIILTLTKNLYLVDDPYVSLNICLLNLRKSANMIKITEEVKPDVVDLWKFVTADLCVATSLILLYIASDTIGLSKSQRERRIIERLTYGDISPNKAREIFRLAKELAIETAKSLNPEKPHQTFLPFDIGQIQAPEYAQNIIGLVERALASPLLYNELPQLMDYLLFEQSLHNREFSDEEYRKTFPSTQPEERLKVARNIFAFLRDNAGVDLKVFWPKQENHLPKKQ